MADTNWTHAHRFTLPGAVPDVFRAWTDPIELQRWFAEHVAIEPRVGGVFRFWGRHTYGVPVWLGLVPVAVEDRSRGSYRLAGT